MGREEAIAALKKAGLWHEEIEPYKSLDEMHADNPPPPPYDPASGGPQYDEDDDEFYDDGDEMTIDKDGIVRRNGEIEPTDE